MGTPAADRLRRLLPALWLGVLLCVALIATPAPFALLDRPTAGRVVARILAQEAWLSLVLALAGLVWARARARRAAEAGTGSQFSGEMVLLLGVLGCTVIGYFGLQPQMAAARAGQGPWSFGQLHAASSAFYAVKLVLLALLAWRCAADTAPGAASGQEAIPSDGGAVPPPVNRPPSS